MFSLSRYLRKIILNRLDRPQQNYQQRAYNNLEKLYKAVKPGDVILVEGRSEMSSLIRLFSSSHWSHSAFYVGDRLQNYNAPDGTAYAKKNGSAAQHMVVEAYSGEGVIAAPLAKYVDYNIRICRPYGIAAADLEKVIAAVIDRLGMHYDDQNIIAIAFLALQTLWRSRSRTAVKACLGNCNDFQVICSGMIAQAFQSVSYPIIPALLPRTDGQVYDDNNPYGGGLIMRHYSQITPKDFDLSPNFEIIKYNIVGNPRFDYKSLWVDQ
jgi:hypothetical protein